MEDRRRLCASAVDFVPTMSQPLSNSFKSMSHRVTRVTTFYIVSYVVLLEDVALPADV